MDDKKFDDAVTTRMKLMADRLSWGRGLGYYFYNQPVSEFRGGARVMVNGREMGMYGSYGYLGLLGHPRINAAATAAVDKFGTGTHGVRFLAGSLSIHEELEETIAEFKNADAAVTFSSGYVTNLTVISTLLGRNDYVISDKLNHASIVDGCLMSRAKLLRFRHNDMVELERRLEQVPEDAARLVVVDAVFSLDGDVINFPKIVELCQKHNAWLMVDEAHSVGVLGETGRGIEEHFGIENAIDIKMGTLSKTIPSVGGYIAGKEDLIDFLRHASRAYMFSAALPPAQAAAANEAFKVILDEPWRLEKLRANTDQFISGLKGAGFNTLFTETAIVPLICGSDEAAFQMTAEGQKEGLFVLPVISPAVPAGLSRLRATITAAHETEEIAEAIQILEAAGKRLGIIS